MGSLHIMIRQLALLVCLASACQGFVRHNFEDDAENKMSIARGPRSFLGDPQSDAYIDKILENLRQLILDQGMDPMDLPDISTGFSDTILGITWHGEANLREGKFWGLSTIARTGDTSFTVTENVLELTAMLSISRPSAHYRAHADFMGIGVSADADIDIRDVQIYMDATATLTIDGIPEGGLQLKNFYINHLGSIDIDISGLGPLDWILEILVDFIDTFFRGWIKDLVEGLLRDLIQDLLNEIHFPFVNFLINNIFG